MLHMKYLFFPACLCFFISAACAQDSLELSLGAGYGLAAGSQRLPDEVYDSGLSTAKSARTSFGRGLHFNADATWWINSVAGLTAGGSYLITTPAINGRQEYPGVDFGYSVSGKWHSHIAVAMAGIALTIPRTRLHPYIRMGALVPVYSRVTENADLKSSFFTGMNYASFKKSFHLRNTLGYTASAGIAPRLNKHLALFVEGNFQSLVIKARNSTLTSYTTGGVEQISNYNTSARKTIYVKKPEGYVYSPDTPRQALIFSFPYSSIDARMGISIKL